ncbi:hypothetical protein T261_0741 [Streptomyces lydicus]|nr:hypothetical protein T261_0741 [Streptomyces lydicus]
MVVDQDNITDGLLIVSCSRRKAVTSRPVPALDLYQGWVVPLVRARLGAHGAARRRVLILSALHGLIAADHPVTTYEQPMTVEQQRIVSTTAPETLRRHLAAHRTTRALLLMEAPYAQALGPVPVQDVRLITDPMDRHDEVHCILDSWSWP